MAFVDLDEAKLHLGIPESETTHDTELQFFIDAAHPIIEHIVGPVEDLTITDEHHATCGSILILRETPVKSITTVKEYYGSQSFTLTSQPPGTVSPTQYGYFLANKESGKMYRRMNGYVTGFSGEVTVTYVAGRASVPQHIKMALLEDIRALYEQTQIAARPQFGGGGVVMGADDWQESNQGMFPRLAALLESERRMDGVA